MTTTMIGHNHPPSDPELMREMLEESNAKALARAQALIDAADRVPAKIEDQDTSEKITDLVKQIKVCRSALEDGRVSDKAPYLALCRTVDDFFRDPIATLDGAIKRVNAIQRDFLLVQEAKRQAAAREQAIKDAAERDRLANEAKELEDQGKHSQAEAVIEKAVKHDEDAAFFEDVAQERGAAAASSVGELTGARSSLRYTWAGEIIEDTPELMQALWPLIAGDAKQKALNQFVKLNKGSRQIKGAKIYEKADVATR